MDKSINCTKKEASNNVDKHQKLLVFHQNWNGKGKTMAVKEFGEGAFSIQEISIDIPLPPIIDDSSIYLPEDFSADLVLDFLTHPDLSLDLVGMCRKRNIPIIASGQKIQDKWAITPPT